MIPSVSETGLVTSPQRARGGRHHKSRPSSNADKAVVSLFMGAVVHADSLGTLFGDERIKLLSLNYWRISGIGPRRTVRSVHKTLIVCRAATRK